jgi:predicted TIM-barrel fold metal-dependent hydrolase
LVQVNEYGANVTRGNPSKFSFFAALPIPDMNASLAELAYALDTLNASGITLMADLHGKYLGDPQFEPLWGELDKRGTVSAPAALALRGLAIKVPSSQIVMACQ